MDGYHREQLEISKPIRTTHRLMHADYEDHAHKNNEEDAQSQEEVPLAEATSSNVAALKDFRVSSCYTSILPQKLSTLIIG